MTAVKCVCEDWKENFHKINAPFEIPRSPFAPYTGPPFNYCPWCASELVNNTFNKTIDEIFTKSTYIKGKYHTRLLKVEDNSVIDEMVCEDKRDISYCFACMLRWYDKNGGTSKMADASRDRFTEKNTQPVGKVWTKTQWQRRNKK